MRLIKFDGSMVFRQRSVSEPATSKELDFWAFANGVTHDFSRPGKPTTTTSSSRSMVSRCGKYFCAKHNLVMTPRALSQVNISEH
jgi:hypothetical protein